MALQSSLYENFSSSLITVITKPLELSWVVSWCGNDFNTTASISKKFSCEYYQLLLVCIEIIAFFDCSLALATANSNDYSLLIVLYCLKQCINGSLMVIQCNTIVMSFIRVADCNVSIDVNIKSYTKYCSHMWDELSILCRNYKKQTLPIDI